MYDELDILSYNVFYTSLPVLALGIFEQDVCDELSIRYPRLYTPGMGHHLFNPRRFAVTALHGVAISLLVFIIPLGILYRGCSTSLVGVDTRTRIALDTFQFRKWFVF